MCNDTISMNDFARLEETLAEVVQGIRSLKELEGWLRLQHCIESVRIGDYLVKTKPPQKELLVVSKTDDGSTIAKIIDVILYPDQSFGLAGLHDP